MPIVKVERPAMGSLFQIFLEGDDADELERLGYDALGRVEWLEQQLSPYLPDSDISQINELAFNTIVPLAPNITALLARCRQWYRFTGGAFDVTAGKLVEQWEFFKRGVQRGDTFPLPDFDQLEKIVQNIGWSFVALDEVNHTIRLHSREIRLHLGAVGKGYVVQTIADYLKEQGIERVLLHSGYSSIVAVGAPLNAEGWQITVNGKPFLINNTSLSVSSNREAGFNYKGKHYGHLIDPRTGQPIENLDQVAVIADDAADAEALSTAFAVQGKEWSQNFLKVFPQYHALFDNAS